MPLEVRFGKCRACEILEAELHTVRTEKDLLLKKLFELMENKNGKHIEEPPKQEASQVDKAIHPLQQQKWSAQLRAQIEAQDRELAKRIEEDRLNKIKAMEELAGIKEKEKESAGQ